MTQTTPPLLSSLPLHCDPQTPFLHWLSLTTNTCLPTHLALLSTVLGSLSFLAWLFAQLPQIYKNYKIQSTAGLSIYFLVEWLLGDTTNLAGAILTKQAGWQVLVASYYTFVDLIMCFQYAYYTRKKNLRRRAREKTRQETQRPDKGNTRGNGTQSRTQESEADTEEMQSAPKSVPFSGFNFPGFSSSPREKTNSRTITRPNTGPVPSASPRTLIMLSMLLALLSHTSATPRPSTFALSPSTHASTPQTLRALAGKYISWSSTILYLGSRLPQLLKNFRRRSTSGLSLSLFVAAFFGNFFYSASILTNPCAWASYPPHGHHGWVDRDGNQQREWVLRALPFWLGAAGVLVMDAGVGVQFWMYGERAGRYVPVPTDNTTMDNNTTGAEGGARSEIPGQREEPARPVPVPLQGISARDAELMRGGQEWRRVSGWFRGWVPSPSPSMMSFRSFAAQREGSPARGEAGSLLARERAWNERLRGEGDDTGAGNGNGSGNGSGRGYGTGL